MTFRPAVRPGAALLRRDGTHLQVGTDPGIVVPDRPGLLTLLHLIDGVRDVRQVEQLARARAPEIASDAAGVLRELAAAGAVIDAGARRAPRPRLDVVVQSDAHAGPVARAVRTVVTDLALAPAGPGGPGVLVVVTCGESSRVPFERAVVQGVPHLPVVVGEESVRVGPYVHPGLSPCVGCLDHARADWDPGWTAVVPQLGRRRGVPTPPAPAPGLIWSAAALVAAEVDAVSRDVRPQTFGAVVAVSPAPVPSVRRPVAFHHRCGCSLLCAA